MKSRHKITAYGLLMLGLSLAPHAAASKTFPEALRKKLGLSEIAGTGMGCKLCHQDDVGGLKTATKPFGRSVLKAGAMATNVPSLLAALDTIESNGVDSDHDGIGDIDELKAGTDPDVADGETSEPFDEVPLPQTGCNLAHPASRASWAPLAFGLVLLSLRRRRR